MATYLIIDTETTGLPKTISYGNYLPYTQLQAYNTSRLVQIAWRKCNAEMESFGVGDEYIVRPDGPYTYSEKAVKVHGITRNRALQMGIPRQHVFDRLMRDLDGVVGIIAHNSKFDMNVLKSELHRAGRSDIIHKLKSKREIDTMRGTKNFVGAVNAYGLKDPSLCELYFKVFGRPLVQVHNALADVDAVREIMAELVRVQQPAEMMQLLL